MKKRQRDRQRQNGSKAGSRLAAGSGRRSYGGKLRRGVTLEFKINAFKLTGSKNIF